MTVSPDIWYTYRLRSYSSQYLYSYPSNESSILTTVINYPAPTWVYTYDNEGLDDIASAIDVGFDGHPFVTGMSATANSQYDYYTVKLNRLDPLTPLWTDTYDGPDGQGDMGICISVDSNDDDRSEAVTSASDGSYCGGDPSSCGGPFGQASGVEVIVPYQPEMLADFSDIRFYDMAANRELHYWIREKTDAASVTVWLIMP